LPGAASERIAKIWIAPVRQSGRAYVLKSDPRRRWPEHSNSGLKAVGVQANEHAIDSLQLATGKTVVPVQDDPAVAVAEELERIARICVEDFAPVTTVDARIIENG
jgi:hypothetical protein